MMPVGPATRIYLAAGATDLRKSFEGLSDLVNTIPGGPFERPSLCLCQPAEEPHQIALFRRHRGLGLRQTPGQGLL